MRMVERGGVTRLLALKGWREAERERRARGDPTVHFYPFPVCSDLTRASSLVALPPISSTTDASAAAKPRVQGQLSRREQLQRKVRERTEAKQAERERLQADADGEDREGVRGELESVHVPSQLDRLRVCRVYGSAVYREGQTIWLEVGDEREMKAAMRKAEAERAKGDQRPLVLCTGLPKDGGALKVWLPPLSGAAASPPVPPSATFPLLSAEADAAVGGGGGGRRVYGSFLCLFPSASSKVDEGKSSEDGYTLFLTSESYEAVLRYLARGLKLAMLSDSPTGLHFDLAWTAAAPGAAAPPSGEKGDGSSPADWLLTEVRRLINDDAVQLTAAQLMEGQAEKQRQALLDFAVLQGRVVEAQLKARGRTRRATAAAEPLGVVKAVVALQRDGGVQARIHSAQGDEEAGMWTETEAQMRKVPVPSALLAAGLES